MRVIAAGLAVMAGLAGCGSVPYRPAAAGGQAGARTGTTSARTRTGVPPAGTPARAKALALRLLSELVLPAGTRRLPARPVPSALSEPAQGMAMAAGGTGVDLYRLFRLPMSMAAAQQYERAHRPAGLAFSGIGWGSQRGVPTDDMLTADVPPRTMPPGIDTAALVYTIVPQAGGGSLLRADAQVVFFPPRSAAEYLDPAGIRSVTVSTTGPHPVSRIITSRPEIARLARLLDGLHALPLGFSYGCPAHFGGYRLTFTPVSARRPVVVAEPTNCNSVGIVADGVSQPTLMGNALYSIAERLLPPAGVTSRPDGTVSASR